MSIDWGHRAPYRRGRARLRLYLAAGLLLVLAVLSYWRLSDVRLRQMYPFCYRELIIQHARANNLDPLLVASVIRAESNYWSWATSPKGARGLMQITPSTGRWIAGQLGQQGFDDRMLYDPATNIAMGCWYLSHLLEQYGRSLPKALAAWNGGRTNVTGWLAAGQWSGTIDDLDSIPFGETRTFVGRVLANLDWYQRLYAEASQ